MSQHIWLKTKDSQMVAKCVYFRAPYSTRHLRQLAENEKDTTISLIWPGQSAQVLVSFALQKSLEPLAASPEKNHMCLKLAQMAPHHFQ
jgi:hypothetical protein